MYKFSKGWYVKELRANGVTVHPTNRDHLSKYKLHELRTIYNELEVTQYV